MAEKTINSPDHVSVGIVSIGMQLPEPAMAAIDAARQSVYDADSGHIGEQANIISIIEAVKHDRLNNGGLMATIAAGFGWVRDATRVKWRPCETRTVTHQLSYERLHSRYLEDGRQLNTGRSA
jgi:hypothetical protein